MENRVLLLTSTIKPLSPYDKGKRSDPLIRLDDYKKSLQKYLNIESKYIDGIVYCDNSGYDLGVLKEVAECSKTTLPIEFLSYIEPPPPKGVHYGYCELMLIRHALAHSELLRSSSHFLKITGRLYFGRIDHLLESVPTPCMALVDHRGIHRQESGLPLRARTQLMLFNRDFYINRIDSLLDLMPERRDSHIEEFIAYCLFKAGCELDSRDIYYRFLVDCDPSGIAGNGFNYDGFSSRLKRFMGKHLRQLLPALYASILVSIL
jgi:hypothetical protein